jgi:1,4-alpha-glucan branching enzyme
MSKSKTGQKMNSKKVTLSVKAAEAKEVILMGDFNNWDSKIHPMKKSGNGLWNKTVMLAPGKYEYKFLIDGNWETDPSNDQICLNRFGTLNNVLNL